MCKQKLKGYFRIHNLFLEDMVREDTSKLLVDEKVTVVMVKSE